MIREMHIKMTVIGHYTLHQSEWLRSNPQVTTHVGEAVEKEEHSSIAGGMANGAFTLQINLMVPHIFGNRST